MSIRRKTGLIKLIGLIAMLVGLFAIGRTAVQNGFAQAEKDSTLRNVRRVKLNIAEKVANVVGIAMDWANYDATYRYVLDHNPEYIQENISTSGLVNIKINLVAFINTSGKIVHSTAVDDKGNEVSSKTPELVNMLKRIGKHCSADKNGTLSGIVSLSGIPMIVAAEPILTTEGEGPSRGTIVFGMHVSANEIAGLDKLTQTSSTLVHLDSKAIDHGSLTIAQKLHGKEIEVQPKSAKTVFGHTLLTDIWGEPTFLLSVAAPRYIYTQGQQSQRLLLMYLLMFGLMVGLFEYFVMDRLVSKRLLRLSRDVAALGYEKITGHRLNVAGNDELSSVALAINNTLDALDQSQLEIRENELKLKTILDSVNIAVLLIDPDDHSIIDANISAVDMVKTSKPELIGRNCSRFLCDNGRTPCPATDMKRQMDTCECRLNREDGSSIPVLKTVVSTVLHGKTMLVESFVDITELKEAEEALRRAHDELEIRVQERTSELASTNEALQHEVTEREQAAAEIYTRLQYEEGLASCSQALLGEGSKADIMHAALSWLHRATGVSKVQYYEIDRQSENNLLARRTVEACGEESSCRLNNPSLQNISLTDTLGRWYDTMLAGNYIVGSVSDLPEIEANLLLELEAKTLLAIPVNVAGDLQGFLAFMDCIDQHSWNEYNIRMLCTASEIIGAYIERNRAEENLRIALNKNEKLLLSISSAMIVCDSGGIIHEWNGAAETILGVSADGAIEHSLFDIGLQWEDQRTEIRIMRAVQRGEASNLGHISVIRPDQESVTLQLTAAPVLDSEGNTFRCLLSGADVTEQQSLELQLQHSQKLESIGQLAAGIAHEMNTPIQYVGDNTRFLQESFQPVLDVLEVQDRALELAKAGNLTEEVIEEIENAKFDADIEYLAEQIPKATVQSLEGITRVAKIVKAMKQFSHPGSNDFVEEDLNLAIESTITVCKNEWKYIADLEMDLDPDLPLVPCMMADLNQVVLNLIVNAAHAISDAMEKNNTKTKGVISVSTRQNGDWIEIRIGDTGPGIPEAIKQRIFEPFFTTKRIGKGTGQGLALARSIVTNMHGGTINFESVEGQGTTFVICIPAQRKAA